MTRLFIRGVLMKATYSFVKCSENEGVEYLNDTVNFIHSLLLSSIQHIVVRYKQSEAFMADVMDD